MMLEAGSLRYAAIQMGAKDEKLHEKVNFRKAALQERHGNFRYGAEEVY